MIFRVQIEFEVRTSIFGKIYQFCLIMQSHRLRFLERGEEGSSIFRLKKTSLEKGRI